MHDEGSNDDPNKAQMPTVTFDELLADARRAATLEDVQTVLSKAKEVGVGAGQQKLLEVVLAESTDLDKSVISAVAREVKMTVTGLGVVSSYDTAVAAYTRFLDEVHPSDGDQPGIAFCGSKLWTYTEEAHHYSHVSEEELDEHLLETFRGSWTIRTVNDLREVKRRVLAYYSRKGFFDDAAEGLPLANTFVRFDGDTGAFVEEPLSRSHKARFRLEADFIPTAQAPAFTHGLQRLLGEAELGVLQEALGCLLFRVKPRNDDVRRMLILCGVPGSGKSTFIEVVRAILPPELVASVPPQSFKDEFARARLAGVWFNHVSEMDGSKLLPTTALKQITAGETVTGRHRYGQETEIRPIAFHVFATNELPQVNDPSGALDRRIIVVPFERSLDRTQMDSQYLNRVRRELPGVIAWAAEGATRLMQRGYFELPPGHAKAMLRMKFKDDVIALFVHTRLERAPGHRVSSSDLQANLRDFASAEGFDRAVASGSGAMRRLSGLMEAAYGAERSPSNNAPYYTGVRLKGAASPPSQEDDFEGL